MHFSLVYKELECVNLKERNRKKMYDQLKRRYKNQRKKSTALLRILVLKKF